MGHLHQIWLDFIEGLTRSGTSRFCQVKTKKFLKKFCTQGISPWMLTKIPLQSSNGSPACRPDKLSRLV